MPPTATARLAPALRLPWRADHLSLGEHVIKAGSTLPLKWSISGPGVNAGTVTSARFLSDGASYKMVKSGPHWHLNVQTPKTWAATSQGFRITLVDGPRTKRSSR